MKVIINKNRKVVCIGNENPKNAGIINENKVETMYFQYPSEYEDYNKVIFFKDTSEQVDFDVILNDEYIIQRNVTTKGRVDCQVAFMNAEVTEQNLQSNDTIVFESEIFPLVFGESIIDNADELITDEQVSLINTLVEQLNTKIEEVDNIDIDLNKINNITTVTIDKKDGTSKSADIIDGIDGIDGVGLDYNWNNTALGVKREDESEYQYVELKGEKGDCNFATFDIEDGDLIMNKDEDMNIDFEINQGNLEVIING